MLVMSSPSSSTRPADSRSNPNTAFIAVDLPAPLGPMMTVTAAASTLSETP